MSQLTEKQEKILTFIRHFIAGNHYPPTIRDIGEEFDISSCNGVVCHLTALKKRGLIDWTPNKSRSLRLTEKKKCPHCGEEL